MSALGSIATLPLDATRWLGRRLYTTIHHRRGVAVEIEGERHRVSAQIARGIPRRIDAPALPLWLAAVGNQSCVVDVGANVGIWSILAAARMSPGARVFSVEPTPRSFEILRDCARVSDAPAQIIPIHAALGDSTGVARLHVDGPTAATNHLTSDGNAEGAVDVPLTTLDALCAEQAIQPGAIKVDVEGWEVRVLQGGREMLERCRPLIILELHWGGETALQPRDVLALSRGIRYELRNASGIAIEDEDTLLHQNFVEMRPR